MAPRFSIILPTYNRATLIQKAIQSVFDQSILNWELIIVDDGSTDNTKEIINQYQDDRLLYFKQENQGRSSARNLGIAKSKAKWICFLDSDDGYDPDHLETFQKAIRANPNATVFKSGVQFIDKKGKVLFKSKFKTDADNPLHFFSLKYCSILDLCIKKERLNRIDFEKISTWEDKAFILDVLADNQFHQLSKRTVNALEHSNRSVLKVYKNPSEINTVLKIMSDKLNLHNAPKQLVSKVQQNFILSILIDAKNSNIATDSIVSKLDIKPSFSTQLKLFKASLFGN